MTKTAGLFIALSVSGVTVVGSTPAVAQTTAGPDAVLEEALKRLATTFS